MVIVQMVCKGVFKFCLRRMLGERQRATLFVFLDCLSRVLSESHQIGDLPSLEEEMNVVIALFERDFPISVQVRFCTKVC